MGEETTEERKFGDFSDKLNLISDLFSRVVFQDKRACQELIDIILGKGFRVKEVSTQKELANFIYHSVVLDILARTIEGKKIHVEFQISDKEDHIRRVRYCTGSIDTHTLEKGAAYDELPELYHIFITERDFIGAGQPVYELQRCAGEEHDISLDNGVHEIYVNLESPPATESELAGLLRYIKETTKENERDYFSDIVKSVNSCREQGKDRDVMKYYNSEEFYQEGKADGFKEGKSDGIEEGKREVITNMLKEKMDEEIISRVTKRPIEYVLSVKEEMFAMVQEETTYNCEE